MRMTRPQLHTAAAAVGLALAPMLCAACGDPVPPDSKSTSTPSTAAPLQPIASSGRDVGPSASGASTTARPRPSRTFDVNKTAKANDDYVIQRVTITDRATEVFVSVKGSSENESVYLSRPGSKGAYFIKDANRSKKYLLLSVQGAPVEPRTLKLTQGVFTDFSMTFERLDDDVASFHLIDGDEPSPPGWENIHFMDISLR